MQTGISGGHPQFPKLAKSQPLGLRARLSSAETSRRGPITVEGSDFAALSRESRSESCFDGAQHDSSLASNQDKVDILPSLHRNKYLNKHRIQSLIC